MIKKVIVTLFFVFFNSHAIAQDYFINPEYRNEIVKRCPTVDEAKAFFPIFEDYCQTNFDGYYTEERIATAIIFAKKIKYAYRTQDFELLANLLPYPLEIRHYKNKNIKIYSKEQFLKLDKKIILNKKIYKRIDEERLFWNWMGYAIGWGDIWFWIDDKEVSRVEIILDF